ncbi:PAS domain-containing protein [Halopelagius longus]|uniref:histidine kinase n=1 Tax=Halopelagius longus TaxID=1236180 RepID=A0A1H1B2E4_9EURY|nr:PAS domain-containing protein [Halopelagius longus]RDI72980.1 PAS domain S-box protein [Halopelagius longus]SDQ45616.1 PAS domain S-box-containing protein [Halopelagius longus]
MEDSRNDPERRLDTDVREHLDRVSDAVFALDSEFRFTYLNEKAQRLLERDESDLLGSVVWEEFPGATGTEFQRQYERALREMEEVTFTEYYAPLETWFEVNAFPSETGLTVYFRDVTAQRERERRIEVQRDRLDLLETFTHVVADVSNATEEAVSRTHIEQMVCSRLVETTSLRFAWAGRFEGSGEELIPSAWAGHEDGYLDEVTITADDSETGRGPAGRAATTGEVQVSHSIETDPEFEPWREAALERGYRSCACLPLRYDDRTYGILGLYAGRENAFAEPRDDAGPLDRLADTVAHAVHTVERRERERELRRRREEFSALVKDVEEYAIFRLDAEGHVASWNRGAEEIKGYEEHEILGRHFSTFYPEEYREEDLPAELLERAAEEGQANHEGWRVRKDGSRFWASVAITALTDEEGNLRGYIKVVRDMTDRKRRERRLEAVFNKTFQFMGLLEPDGTVVKVNDAAVQFAATDRDDLIGHPFWEVPWWGGDDEVAGLRDAIRWAAAGEFVRFETNAGAPDSENEATVDVSITPVTDETGEVVLLVLEGRDITERKRREHELRRERERIEFVNRVLRHNLLNGLNVVSARADILGDFVPEDGQTHLETLRDRVEEMADLVETMRSFTRAVGQESHNLEPVELGSTLAHELEAIDDEYDRATVATDGPIPEVEVMADELLSTVFEHLLTNAVQHNDKDEPRVTVSVAPGEEYVEVRVADNGPGVSDEAKERIVDKSVEELSTPGGGFGLFLVKELIDCYGGTITVGDNDPEGAVFTVSLPTA